MLWVGWHWAYRTSSPSTFFLRALGSGFGGSVVVPINNVGIILLSAVLGVLLFSEKFKTVNLIGVVAAVLAILLISIGA